MEKVKNEAEFNEEELIGMDELRRGAAAYIALVEARGEIRRRLEMLGCFPGERVEKVLVSPLGDPSAYLLRGTVTALRSSDANHVRVSMGEAHEEAEKWG